MKVEMGDKDIETHETCASTPLDKTKGSRPEHINKNLLDQLYEEQTGTPISSDPVASTLRY